jgi:hypothetical protein
MAARLIKYSVQCILTNENQNIDKLQELYILDQKLFCQEFVKYAKMQFNNPIAPVQIAMKFPSGSHMQSGYVFNQCVYFAWLHGNREELALLLQEHEAGKSFLASLMNAAQTPRPTRTIDESSSLKGMGEKLVLAVARSEEEALEIATAEQEKLILRYKAIISELNNLHTFIDFIKSIDLALTNDRCFC